MLMRMIKLGSILSIAVLTFCPATQKTYSQSSVPTETTFEYQASSSFPLDVKLSFQVVSTTGVYVTGGQVTATFVHNNGPVTYACDADIANGIGTCEWYDNQGPGNYYMTVNYSGTPGYAPSSDGPIAITVYEE